MVQAKTRLRVDGTRVGLWGQGKVGGFWIYFEDGTNSFLKVVGCEDKEESRTMQLEAWEQSLRWG